jgi:all-trans-retinol 13,14-reductase
MNNIDVLIIGSGLGGLECGLILSREGMKVCVLEQHHSIGGNLQTFTRDGCVFDTGMHYLGSLGEGEYLHKYFSFLGLAGKLKLRRLDADASDVLSFDGDDTLYTLAQGYENFVNRLSAQFPDESKAVETYMREVRTLAQSFPLYRSGAASSYHLPVALLERCATGFIRGLTNNERLRNILSGSLTLYAGNPEITPLYIHACMRESLTQSCWRPVDGSAQIAGLLAAGITDNGGTIITSARVKEIIVETGCARGVVLEDGQKLFAGRIISNAHPAATLNLIPEDGVRKIYRKRISALSNTWGVFTLYAVLRKGTFPYLNSNYFHYNQKGILHARHDVAAWPDNYYFYTPAVSGNGEFAESLVMMADMPFSEVAAWRDTTLHHRGEGYQDFKRQKAEKMLDALERRLPGIKGKISRFYASTPLTFRDYTGTFEGSAYGIMKDCNNPLRSIILSATKVRNLFFTGQNLNLYGALGVSAAAVITCSEILGLEYLTKKIANG